MPAPGRAVLHISHEGLDRLLARLSPEAVYGDAVAETLNDAADLAEQMAQKRAPRASGRLAGSVGHELRASTTNPYAVVHAMASNNGFPYGYALNAGAIYHYRGAPGTRRTKRTRRATKGWFSKVPAAVRAALRGMLRKAEQQIERKWGA